jgi:hypothetical protein
MRRLSKHTVRRAIGVAVILAGSIGLSGCYVPEGVNAADAYGEMAGFCGLLQDCGSDSDSNRGGEQTATGTSSSSSSRSSSSGGTSGETGGEGATATSGE